jgi:hypothetical protein
MSKGEEQLRIVSDSIFCPHSATPVRCQIAEVDGTPLEVVCCSPFADGPVTCDKLCLSLLNRGWDLGTDGDG